MSERAAVGAELVSPASLGHSRLGSSPSSRRLAEAGTGLLCPELGPLGETGSPPTLRTSRTGYRLDVRPPKSCTDSPAVRRADGEGSLVVIVAVLLSQSRPGRGSVFLVDLCGGPVGRCDLGLEKPLPGRLSLLGRSRPGPGGWTGTGRLGGSRQRSQQDGGRAPRAGAALRGGTFTAALAAGQRARVLPRPVALPAPGGGSLSPP